MISPQLPLGNNFEQALNKWGAELRNYKFVEGSDFEISDFTPTVTGTGTLTFSPFTVTYCKLLRYKPLKIALVAMELIGTTAGAGTILTIGNLPIHRLSANFFMGSTNLLDGLPMTGWTFMNVDQNYFSVSRYDFANFGVGTNRFINVGIIMSYA